MDQLKKIGADAVLLGALLGLLIGTTMDSFAVGVGIAIIFSITFRKSEDEDDEK
ncbi:hypothetical protein SAMN04488126_103211 [Bhargavaea beijingensis]|uniref:Uncharacterized protein n=1 Tax=Bhargavaea beijingensis TaxID=426756 RepID=A0A1G7A694_9BACL|nr:hypothetical protein [Bhargavaea beijingensis]SDE10339.1 hypothetical protein SAMN04488126_103211 [Bhargavaea beijingensis]